LLTVNNGKILSAGFDKTMALAVAFRAGPGWLTEPFHNLYHDKFRHFMFSQMGGAKVSSIRKGDLQVVASS
jgi:hypothetical protein